MTLVVRWSCGPLVRDSCQAVVSWLQQRALCYVSPWRCNIAGCRYHADASAGAAKCRVASQGSQRGNERRSHPLQEASANIFLNNHCWLCITYCSGFLLLSSWPCIVLYKVAFGPLFSITPAGPALCTEMGSCSHRLGLGLFCKSWPSAIFFNNPCWFCCVYCDGSLFLSSWPCVVL